MNENCGFVARLLKWNEASSWRNALHIHSLQVVCWLNCGIVERIALFFYFCFRFSFCFLFLSLSVPVSWLTWSLWQEHNVQTYFIKRDEPMRPRRRERKRSPQDQGSSSCLLNLRNPSLILNAGLLASSMVRGSCKTCSISQASVLIYYIYVHDFSVFLHLFRSWQHPPWQIWQRGTPPTVKTRKTIKK